MSEAFYKQNFFVVMHCSRVKLPFLENRGACVLPREHKTGTQFVASELKGLTFSFEKKNGEEKDVIF